MILWGIIIKNLIYLYNIHKKGHYSELGILLRKLYNCIELFNVKKQIITCFKKNTVIFLDGDRLHLMFFPLIIIRSLLSYKSILFAIHTELVFRNSFKDFFRKSVLRFLKMISYCYIISINKSLIHLKLKKYVNFFIYDTQLWDLSYLNFGTKNINEFDIKKIKRPIILIFGVELNEKRNREEVIKYLNVNKHLDFSIIFSCKVNSVDKLLIKQHKNCYLIDRYISNEEMIFLFKNIDYFFCYYDVNLQRPSGIFGRALQLNKYIIVKKGGYLEKAFYNYEGLIALERFQYIDKIMKEKKQKIYTNLNYDDSKLLYQIIYKF